MFTFLRSVLRLAWQVQNRIDFRELVLCKSFNDIALNPC